MRRICIILMFLALAFVLETVGYAADPISEFTRAEEKIDGQTKHFRESLFKKTDKGFFTVELLIGGKKLSAGQNKIDLVVHDSRDTDVEGADVRVGIRPAVQDSPLEEFAGDKGGGLYRIEMIRAETRSTELFVKVRKGKKEDIAVFDLTGSKP
jgi:hypothetical protein